MSYANIFIMNVDTHFHIFNKSYQDELAARYSVNYNASIDDWTKEASAQQISRGVIVQPSFLGFDNTILLEAIKQNPGYLKGIAVIDSGASREELLELHMRGVCGIRLNLYGDKDHLATLLKYQELIQLVKELNMHLQIHHADGLLNEILLAIPNGLDIVIDHFGRPQTNAEFKKQSDGIQKHQGKLWVKLSAQYRTPNINHQALFEYWLEEIGASRLLWGSDWPHTRFENSQTYESQMRDFVRLTNSPELRQKILSANPMGLYWS